MIRLEVEDFCQECDYFEAECKSLLCDGESLFVVQCENHDLCGSVVSRAMSRLLAKLKEEESKNAKD